MIDWSDIKMFEIVIWIGTIFVLFPAWIYLVFQMGAHGIMVGKYRAMITILKINEKEKKHG